MMYHDNYKQISITIIGHRLSELLHFLAFHKSCCLALVGSYLDTLCYPYDQLAEAHLENILFFSHNLLACNLYTIHFYICRIFQVTQDDDHTIQDICQFLLDIFLPPCTFRFILHIFKALLDIYPLLLDIYQLILSIFIVILALHIYLGDHILFFYLYHIFHICYSLFDHLFCPYDNVHIYHRALYIFFNHIRDHEYLFQSILFSIYTYHSGGNILFIYNLFFIFLHSFCFFLSSNIYQNLCNLSSIFSLAYEEIFLYIYRHSYRKNSLNTFDHHSSSFQSHHIFWRPLDHPSTYHSDSYDNVTVLYCLPFHTRP